MKKWTDLTTEEQSLVREKELVSITKGLLEVGPDFIGEKGHTVRTRYEAIIKQMDRMQTPWFVGEMAFHDETVGGWIREETEAFITDAETIYLEPGERALRIPHVKQVNP